MAVIVYVNAAQASVAHEVSSALDLSDARLVHLAMPTAPSLSQACVQAEQLGGTELEDVVFEEVLSATMAALLDGEDLSAVAAVITHEGDDVVREDLEHFLVTTHKVEAEFVRVEQNSSTGAQWPTYCTS